MSLVKSLFHPIQGGAKLVKKSNFVAYKTPMSKYLLDILIAVPLLWGLIRGIMRGFIFEIAILAALTLGMAGGFALAGLASGYLAKSFAISGRWLPSLSFFVVFSAISLLIIILGKALTSVISITGLGIPNRLLGGLFGFCKWWLITGIAVWLLTPMQAHFQFISKQQQDDSYLYTPLKATGRILAPALSEPLQERLNPTDSAPAAKQNN